MYIADDARLRPEYNLPTTTYDPDRTIAQKLQNKGMDALLASHYANILARDPVAMTEKDLESYTDAEAGADADGDSPLDVFEILHSAVWPHVDFKLPSKDGHAGWRIELRPLEVQLTDFDNAAFVVFVALLARTILHFNLNFYIPIGKVAENMARAHTRNAVVEEKFFFRRDVPSSSSSSSPSASAAAVAAEQERHVPFEAEYTLMSIDEIMNGSRSFRSDGTQSVSSSSSFEGLIPLVERYIREIYAGEFEHEHERGHGYGHERGEDERVQTNNETPKHPGRHHQLFKYLDMIRARAAGKLATPATWMRRFVQRHERYLRDSVVSERICYDLMCAIRYLEEKDKDEDTDGHGHRDGDGERDRTHTDR
jgi:glutamate--cysteine ligase catalytic subunit